MFLLVIAENQNGILDSHIKGRIDEVIIANGTDDHKFSDFVNRVNSFKVD